LILFVYYITTLSDKLKAAMAAELLNQVETFY